MLVVNFVPIFTDLWVLFSAAVHTTNKTIPINNILAVEELEQQSRENVCLRPVKGRTPFYIMLIPSGEWDGFYDSIVCFSDVSNYPARETFVFTG